MKILKIIIFAIGLFFVGIQLYRPARENPPVDETQTIFAAMNVPEDARKILERSCADCHSHKTNWVWYSQIQPAMWFMSDHVNEGRAKLNFSIWGSYEARRKRKKLGEICEEISDKSMPLPSYLWLHGDAHLSEGDVKVLCDWTRVEMEKIPQETAK